jgi:hypothetical protein
MIEAPHRQLQPNRKCASAMDRTCVGAGVVASIIE